MNNTVRQKILNNLTTELLLINTANGYNNTIAEVKKGYFPTTSINNFPTASVYFGPDIMQSQIEGYTYGDSDLDVVVLVYINSPEEEQVDAAEEMIEDLYRFFNRDESIPAAYTSTLEEITYVQNYKVVEANPYVAGNKNISSIGILIKINYFNFIEQLVPFAPTLLTPADDSINVGAGE